MNDSLCRLVGCAVQLAWLEMMHDGALPLRTIIDISSIPKFLRKYILYESYFLNGAGFSRANNEIAQSTDTRPRVWWFSDSK